MNDSINFLKRIDKGAFLIIYFILLLFSGYYFLNILQFQRMLSLAD